MKKSNIILAIVLLIPLSSCDVENLEGPTQKKIARFNLFALQVPAELQISNSSESDRKFISNDFKGDDLNSAEEYRIETNEGLTSCPNLGIIEPKEMQLEGDKGTWAKMPINRANEDTLFCMPPMSEKCTEEMLWSSGCNDGTAAYAFCAEKDGKAVAICIQQMTDDEAMAKEIFESFRWTD